MVKNRQVTMMVPLYMHPGLSHLKNTTFTDKLNRLSQADALLVTEYSITALLFDLTAIFAELTEYFIQSKVISSKFQPLNIYFFAAILQCMQ